MEFYYRFLKTKFEAETHSEKQIALRRTGNYWVALWAGFEPARGDPIGFRVQRLNHSAITALPVSLIWTLKYTSLGPWFTILPTNFGCSYLFGMFKYSSDRSAQRHPTCPHPARLYAAKSHLCEKSIFQHHKNPWFSKIFYNFHGLPDFASYLARNEISRIKGAYDPIHFCIPETNTLRFEATRTIGQDLPIFQMHIPFDIAFPQM